MNKTVTQELTHLKRNQQFLAIMVLLFVCALFWTIVSLVSSQQQSVISSELRQLALPLTPVIDTDALSELESKRAFTQAELADFTIFRLIETEQGDAKVILPLGTEPELTTTVTEPTTTFETSPAATTSASPFTNPSTDTSVTPTDPGTTNPDGSNSTPGSI